MTKVFVIDDSLTVRNGFKNLIEQMDDIVLLGEAENPIDAIKKFSEVGLPDLFILDIEMPKMDGLTFLKKINSQRPTPVIICSTLVGAGSNKLIESLRLGAIDIIEKPKSNVNKLFITYKEELIAKIRVAVNANNNYRDEVFVENNVIKKNNNNSQIQAAKIIAIGSSTGGVQVLEEIFTHLDLNHQAIVVVQHIPRSFSFSLAKRLNELCENSLVKEAEDGDIVMMGTIYIAPGGVHLEVEKRDRKYFIRLKYFPKVNSHRPSINVFFNSISKSARTNAIGFLLTGMGNDGAKGLKNMLDSGANTYVQNKQTSVVYGMAKIAWDMGSAKEELSIYEIIKAINKY